MVTAINAPIEKLPMPTAGTLRHWKLSLARGGLIDDDIEPLLTSSSLSSGVTKRSQWPPRCKLIGPGNVRMKRAPEPQGSHDGRFEPVRLPDS